MAKPTGRPTGRPPVHGMTGTAEHYIWLGLLQRCLCSSYRDYHRYGGRGITVCKRWQVSFVAFLDDMGTRPSPELTLGRIDNDGPYSPENCRWETPAEQARNRVDNRWLTFRGRTMCIMDWALEMEMKPHLLYGRIRRGWSTERALTQELRHHKRKSG